MSHLKVTDIHPDQFGAWRAHPVTVFMFDFYKAKAEAFEATLVERWRAGNLKLVDEQEGRGRVMTLTEITEINWNSILSFYGLEPKPENPEKSNEDSDAAKNDEQQSD
jgi:hypothetical protein